MLDALPYLVDYPYGCVEQTLSRFLPAVIVTKTLREHGLSVEDALTRVSGGIELDSAAKTHPKGKEALRKLQLAAIKNENLFEALMEAGTPHGMRPIGMRAQDTAELFFEGVRVPADHILGGAEGLDRAVLDRAEAALSLGRLTWPHLLARAMLAEVLQRPDIQPDLKNQLAKAQLEQAQPSWQWQALAQTAYGHESNLNSATYTDTLTLYLSNGPVTLGLTDNVKPVAGDAFKSSVALQGTLRGAGLQELSVNAAINNKSGAASA